MADYGSPALRKALRFTALGAEVSGTVIGAAIVGYFLDDWLETSPILLLIMLLAGGVGTVFRLIKLGKALQKDAKNDDAT